MNKTIHPIEPEELMAYLDGELPADRAKVAAAHVSECAECTVLSTELRAVSARLQQWQIEIPEAPMPNAIAATLQQMKSNAFAGRTKKLTWRNILPSGRISLAWGGALALALIFVVYLGTTKFASREAIQVPSDKQQVSGYLEPPPGPSPPPATFKQFDGLQQFEKLQKAPDVNFKARVAEETTPAATASNAPGPMIIRTADLSLITKEFDKSRAGIEAILKRHRGYIANLKVAGVANNGRTLTGSLRVPTEQLEGVLAELKALGRVESESQSGQDVTSQYVDLQARLANARNTEKRLTDLLQKRTGELSDVLEVEQEVDRVRGEIEQMEAERKTMSMQVNFATINVTLAEDYKAQLQVVPPSITTRLSNAAVEGYRSMVEGLVSVILFFLSNGPTLVLWMALLFLPARFVWRKVKNAM
jgi:hypothetical protein